MGLFNLLNPASFPPDLQREGLGFSSALWSQVGAQGVVKLQVTRQARRHRPRGPALPGGPGRGAGADARPTGARRCGRWCYEWVNDVIGQFTGTRGIFGSRIAFAMTGRQSEIASVGADGARSARC